MGLESDAETQAIKVREADLEQRSLGPYLPTHSKDIDAILKCIDTQIA